jgi:Tol biopolymer transport system component
MGIRKTGGAVAVLALCAVAAGCASDASEPSAGASAPPSEAPPTPHPFAGEASWIAYQTYRGEAEGVWLIHPDGTDDHEIGIDIPGERVHPDWSPDGSRLVVTSRTDRDVLYLVDVVSDAAEVLFPCTEDCVGDDEAVWSPDGTRIAFVRAMEPFVNDAPTCALFIGDLEDRSVEQLGEARSCWDRETFPHWSRDGSRIAYYRGVYEGDETMSTALYVFDVEGRQETRLTDDGLSAGDSDWSSGDEWIVFSTFPLNDFQCCQVSNLFRICPDGTGLEQLTAYESDALRATQPRYTPDGSSIVFTAVTSSDRVPWVIPADGGEPIAVAASGIYTHPTWQPDR